MGQIRLRTLLTRSFVSLLVLVGVTESMLAIGISLFAQYWSEDFASYVEAVVNSRIDSKTRGISLLQSPREF